MKNTWWVKKDDLIEEQSKVIELPVGGSYLVLGPPGSGKTNLLLLRASYLTFAGKANLAVIVFTRTLQEFLRAGANQYDFPDNRIQTLLSWETSILADYGIRLALPSSFQKQRRLLLEELEALIKGQRLRNLYDVILLDEAQDYWPEELEIFGQLANDLFIVADSRQKIYGGADVVPFANELADETVRLRHHFRNGLKICRLADAIAEDREDYEAMEPTSNYDEGKFPSTVETHFATNLSAQTARMLGNLELQLKAYPGELIGIACPRNEDVERVWDEIQKQPYAETVILQRYGSYSEFADDTAVCVSSCHAMKGLEFRALHILSAERFNGMSRKKNVAFTSVTRAKTSLDIYHSGDLPSFLDGAIAKLHPVKDLPTLDQLFSKGT